MKKKFIQTIEKYSLLDRNDSVLVALSGGPDSTLLLHLLHDIRSKYNLNLGAVYINHQIRKRAAEKEESFCSEFCESLGISFHLVREDIPKLSKKLKKGLEETGREFRYDCFQKLSDEFGYTKIALGHHADDRVETILFRLIRGTGKLGLIGFMPKRDRFIRPLYDFTKAEILKYVKEKKIKFCIDETNRDNTFSRNFIRNELLPDIKRKFNHSVEASLLNLADTVFEEEEFLNTVTEKKSKKIVSESPGGKILLKTGLLKKEKLWLRRRIVRKILSGLIEFMQVDKETVDMVDAFLFSEKPAISLPGKIQMRKVGEVIVVSHTKKLKFSKKLEVGKKDSIKQLRSHITVTLKDMSETKLFKKRQSYFGQFDYTKLTPPFTIRTIQTADRFSPLGLKGSKKIGDYLTDKKVAPVFRDEIPVVTDKKGIFWLVGYEIDNRVKIDESTKEVLEIELNAEK